MKKLLIYFSIAFNVLFFGLVIKKFAFSKKNTAPIAPVYWLHKDELLKDLPIDSNSIVFVGDSHFENFEITDLFGSINYKNRGINFDTSKGLLSRMPNIVKGSPKKIFIQIGTNDILKGVPTDEVVKNLASIIRLIRSKSPTTKVFILGVIRNGAESSKLSSRYQVLSKLFDVSYIDTSFLLDKNSILKIYDSGDGTHLNSKGYSALHKLLSRY